MGQAQRGAAADVGGWGLCDRLANQSQTLCSVPVRRSRKAEGRKWWKARASGYLGGHGCFDRTTAKISTKMDHGPFVYRLHRSRLLRFVSRQKMTKVALGCGPHFPASFAGIASDALRLYSGAGDAHPPPSSRAAHRLVLTRSLRTPPKRIVLCSRTRGSEIRQNQLE